MIFPSFFTGSFLILGHALIFILFENPFLSDKAGRAEKLKPDQYSFSLYNTRGASPGSPPFPLPEKTDKKLINNAPASPPLLLPGKISEATAQKKESLASLRQFFETKTALEIHNKALRLLKDNQKAGAILLLERNLYHNFFFPSLSSLFHLKVPVFFSPFLWHILLLLSAVICFVYLVSAFNRPRVSSFKKLISLSLVYFAVFGSGLLTIKSRVSPLEKIDLKSTPYDSAAVNTTVEKNSHLLVLKQTKDWVRAQTPDKQTGWVKKRDVFQIF